VAQSIATYRAASTRKRLASAAAAALTARCVASVMKPPFWKGARAHELV
jgi:hypothetical protein